jgi:hypothetical protein
MLTLTGVIRAVTTLGGGVNKKTGEVIPTRPVLQVEGLDNRGLVQLFTLTVPDTKPFEGKVGEQVTVPVRAWAPGAQVSLAYEGARCEWGTQQAAACGRWRMPGGTRRRPLAAALEFIHTNNCSNPISMRVCGLLRAAVYSSKHRSRVASKATSRHGFGPCNFSCVVCDLMAWGSGGFPRAGRADGTT